MEFKLNRFSEDDSTGHSVYEFSILERTQEDPQISSNSQKRKIENSKNRSLINKGFINKRKLNLSNKEVVPFLFRELIKIKVEAFTIKQLLN
ncbi:MAG: hypothetical protein QNJ31_09135 [Candidatus Caenarcaniphilales bacterium]|nr:hypothetical protein [Candidatus Caenarcaniphilales bacterium]